MVWLCSGGGGAKSKQSWEERFAELVAFVKQNGHRPRRTAEDQSERLMHFWLAQQQKKLREGSLPPERASQLAIVLDVKGPRSGGAHGDKGSSKKQPGSSPKPSASGQVAAEGKADVQQTPAAVTPQAADDEQEEAMPDDQDADADAMQD